MTPDDIAALRQALAEHVTWHKDGLGCTADSEEWGAACSPRRIARLLDALEAAQKYSEHCNGLIAAYKEVAEKGRAEFEAAQHVITAQVAPTTDGAT